MADERVLDDENPLYTVIGRAVMAVQLFEFALTPIYGIYKRIAAEGQPFPLELQDGEWKVPLSAIVKDLRAKGQINEDFATRLLNFSEARHLLIHRWMKEHGRPADSYEALWAHAEQVEGEALELGHIVLRYVVKWGDPERAGQNLDEYKAKMLALFRDAHAEYEEAYRDDPEVSGASQ